MSWQETVRFLKSISKINLLPSERDGIAAFFASRNDMPWEPIAHLAETEGIAGLLYRHLKSANGIAPPEAFLKRLETLYHQTTFATRAVLEEAKRLSGVLEQDNISVIAIQGLSLIDLYGDTGLRPFGDMDILVQPSRKERIKHLLKKIGFQVSNDVYPDLFYKTGIWIDIHTHVLNLDRIRARQYLFPKDLNVLWDRAVPFFSASKGLLRLEPHDNFIMLSAHTLKHGYSKLIWLVDLHESLLKIAERTDGWEAVVERARFWHQEKTVLYSLIILEGMFGTRFPDRVKKKLGIHKLGKMEEYLLRLKLKGFASTEYYMALCFFSIRKIRHKIGFIKETIFPRDEIMTQIFPQESHRTRRTRLSHIAHRASTAMSLLYGNTVQALRLTSRKT